MLIILSISWFYQNIWEQSLKIITEKNSTQLELIESLNKNEGR